MTQLTNRKPRDFTLLFGGIGSLLLLLLTTLQPQDIQFNQKASNTSSLKKPATNEVSDNPFGGIETSEWCVEPAEPPIPYDRCKFDSIMFRFGVYGGLTNALHFILKGSIWAMQEDVCFYVTGNGDQGVSKLAYREAPEETINPFLERYFEPIGLPKSSDKVQNAAKSGKVFEPNYRQIQFHEYGKRSGGLQKEDCPDRHKNCNIENLDLWNKENIWLKKHVMRRLLRILPERRTEACSRLNQHGLDEKFIAMSVRGGDKAIEYKLESSMQPYIDEAEKAIKSHFNGRAPTVFVAKIKHWTLQETDDHYNKFLTELIAMASATYWIGVATTNVSLFVYFMRAYE
eukprot:scaffold248428_cov54-Cyclotella_meneghiniana.AAC.1